MLVRSVAVGQVPALALIVFAFRQFVEHAAHCFRGRGWSTDKLVAHRPQLNLLAQCWPSVHRRTP
ncbi:MAG: hypothetical protein DCC68_26665 [Planctomycetota bacterium]|nr:MAG: hypothetical protein DCC68_26665 [Planctomycetota bacterium]